MTAAVLGTAGQQHAENEHPQLKDPYASDQLLAKKTFVHVHFSLATKARPMPEQQLYHLARCLIEAPHQWHLTKSTIHGNAHAQPFRDVRGNSTKRERAQSTSRQRPWLQNL